MIKCDNGMVDVNGTGIVLLSELSTLVHVLHKDCFIEDNGLSAEESRKIITEAVEKGFKTEEEHIDLAKEKLLELLDVLKTALTGKDEE